MKYRLFDTDLHQLFDSSVSPISFSENCKDVKLHPNLIHYPHIFASNFDPWIVLGALILLDPAGSTITANPGSNLNAIQHALGGVSEALYVRYQNHSGH